ncbi:MAG TPA: hypothetical protein P5186_28470 [Candidatus Paceibacterota bacterium]|nr:hypothetical protein [Verrucomicrobiota bacterium]HRY51984.1 hypothetical protein [Candidatus Paceibacterota bacterium]
MNRSNPDDVLPHLDEEFQIALKHFLKRWHRNVWMKNEVGWKETATIISVAVVRSISVSNRHRRNTGWPSTVPAIGIASGAARNAGNMPTMRTPLKPAELRPPLLTPC